MTIKSPQRSLFVSLCAAMLLAVPAMAQEPSDDTLQGDRGNTTREQRREAWNNMSDAERDQVREKMRNNPQARERIKSMTPEQRDAMRERFQSMTPEQREQMRQRHQSGKQGGERGSRQQDN